VAAHRTELRVRFGELDPYNHVNHAVYVAYFEAGRVEALESVGIDLAALAAEGWQLVIVELGARYRGPAVAGDVLTIETGLVSIGAATTRWRQRVLRGPGDEVLCAADIRAGVTDRHGHPRRIPVDMRAALEKLLVDQA
jgi:YbgC/YbaW family acyl-CoA thioester hydrolase